MTQDHIRLMQYDEHLWTWLAYRRYLVRLELQRAMKTFRSHNPELPKEDAMEAWEDCRRTARNWKAANRKQNSKR